MDSKTLKKIEDSEYFYSKKYQVKYYETDFNRALKPSALLNFLQDMATENAEMLGFGPSFVFPKNYAWFLIKYRMEFDEYPCALDELIIKTEARGISKIIASRDFEICTINNKRLGRIASNWTMVDLNTKSILPLSKIVDFMPAFEKRDNDLQFKKISPLNQQSGQINYEKIFEIRFDDIDVNQHVNNANYIVWAFEPLPYQFKSQHKLKTLDIVYKKEIAYGHNVVSQIQFDKENKTSIHVLKNATTGEELCFVNAVWQA